MHKNEIIKMILRSIILIFTLQGILVSNTIKYIKVNNIKVPIIFEKYNSLPILNVQLVFKNSGYIQDKAQSGITSLSAQLLNEGTKKLGSFKFAQKLEENAISLSSHTGFETFVIELSSLKDVHTIGLDLLNQLLKDPNYSEKTLEKLKTIQTGHLKRKENDYDFIASIELKKLIFKNTALENSSLGTIDSISKIKLTDIKTSIDKILNLNNLIVVVGGDFKFNEIKDKLKTLLSSIKTSKKEVLKNITLNDKTKEKIILKDTQQAYIYFASPFYTKINDEDLYMAKVASFILGGSGFGSRLMEEIRVQRGLAYSAYASISTNKSHSYFTGHLQTKLKNTNEAKELVISLVKEFVKNGVTKDELKSAKKFLIGSEPLRSETLSQRLNRAFTLFYRALPQDYPKIELDNIENLKLKDLNNYIKSHKEINNLSFSIVRK